MTAVDVVGLTADYERWLGTRIPLVEEDLRAKHDQMAICGSTGRPTCYPNSPRARGYPSSATCTSRTSAPGATTAGYGAGG